MEVLKLTYYNISQLTPFFKSIEQIQTLMFGQRRALSKLNEGFEKELNALTEEIKKLIERHSEKNEDGKSIVLENGAIKIKEENINQANKELEEIYLTQTEISYIPFKLKEEIFEKFECDKTTFELIEKNFIE